MLSKKEIERLKPDIDKFVDSLTYLSYEPLDGDDTQEIADGVLAKLNFVNGNITEEEYNLNKIGGQ